MTNTTYDSRYRNRVHKSLLLLSLIFILSFEGVGQNNSLQFDGVDDYAFISGGGAAFSSRSAWTLQFWMKFDASTSQVAVMEYGGAAVSVGSGLVDIQDGKGSSVTISGYPDDTNWHHIAVVSTNINDAVAYIDGEVASIIQNAHGGFVSDPAAHFYVGRNLAGDQHLNGKIDELVFWSNTRSQGSIQGDIASGLSMEDPDIGFLEMFYDFNEGTGTIINDQSANNYSGTLLNGPTNTPGADGVTNGPLWAEGFPMANNALDFDGTDDYVLSTNNLGITGANSITLEFWYKNGTNSGITHPVTLGTQVASSGFGFFLSDNDLNFYGETNDYNTGYTFVDNNWHHLAVSYDGLIVRTYVDGVETPTSGQSKVLSIGDGPVYIGAKMDLSSFIQGSIDEVRIWDQAHTASQIANLKDVALRGDEYGLVAYYDFEDGTGSSSLTDKSVNANNGTLINMEPASDWVDGPSINAAESCGTLTIFPVAITENTLCTGGNGEIYFTSNTDTGEPSGYTYKFYQGTFPDPGFLLQEDQVSDGSAGFTYSGLVPGEYTLEVINNDNLCSELQLAIVTDNPVYPEATVSITDNTYCIGGNGELFIQAATSGTGSGNYKGVVYEGIGTGGIVVQDSTSFTGDTGYSVTGLSGNDYIVVIKDDETGCANLFSYSVSDSPAEPVVATESVTIVDDFGSGGSIDATGAVSGGTGDYSYSWHEGTSTAGVVVGTGSSVSGLSAGDYTLEVADNISSCVSIAYTFTILDQTVSPPIAPTNLVGFYRDATSIELAWTDEAIDNTDYLVEWSTSYESFDANIVSSSVVGTADAVGAVVGVGPDQGYFFRVTATNGFEDATSQSGIEFATSEAHPGHALSFDGNDYTNAPETLGDLSTVTISAWVYPRSFGASNSWAYWRGNTTVDQTGGEIYFTPAGLVGYGESDVTYQGITSATALPLNEWSHVAVVKVGGAAQLYINGLPDGDAGIINGTPPNGEISLGARVRTSTDGYFDGLIDEVRVWADSAKTDFSDRFAPLMGNEPKLAVYYAMDENGGSKLVDRSVNTIDADITGATFVASEAGLPIIYNATNVTIAGFTPNVEVPAGAIDMLVDVSTDPNFGSFLPSGQDISIGTSGGVDVSVALNTTTQYYYRVKADFGGTQTGYAVSNSFMVGPGNTFDFPGTNKYVTITDSDELDLSGDATIEFWAYWNGFDEASHAIISKSVDGNSRNYNIYINAEGAIVIHGVNENVTGHGLAELVWTHVAIVQSGTDFLLYLNGELVETISDTWDTVNSSELWIGGDFVNSEWDGQLDEIRIWNYARTEAELLEFAEKTVSANDPGLMAYYRFDEVSSTTLPDLSIYGNDGVFQNSAGTEWVPSNALAIPFNVELSYNGFLSDPSSESTLSINIVFNREVASLTTGDFTVTNATLSNLFTSDNISYTADISPISTGLVQVSLASGVVQDLNSNLNVASNVLEYNYSETTSYTISVPSYGYETLSSPTVLSEVLNDDATSTAQTIGFDFEFFGQTYSSVYVNSNGWVSFLETSVPSAYSAEKFPDPTGSSGGSEGSEANALIAGYWSDLDGSSAPADGYQVELIGTAPNRVYVIQYKDVPHLNNPSNLVNFQIKLFETSNEVEIHCESCYTSDEAFTQGLENQDGTDYSTVLGRNQSVFSIYNDAVKFTPVIPGGAVTEDFETASGGASFYSLPTGGYHAASAYPDGIANSGVIGMRLSYGNGTLVTPLIDGNANFSFWAAGTGTGEAHFTVEKSVEGAPYVVVATPTVTSTTFTEQIVNLSEGVGTAVRIRITFNEVISDMELMVDDITFTEYTGESTFSPLISNLSSLPASTDAFVNLVVDLNTDIYFVISASATVPTTSQISSGLDGDNNPALVTDSSSFGGLTGHNNLYIEGLTPGSTYYIHLYGAETFDLANTTSVFTESFTTVIEPIVTISTESVTGGELVSGSTDNQLYKIRMDVSDADANMVGFVLFPNDSTDNYAQSDFVQFNFFESINTDDLGTATYLGSSFFSNSHPELPDGSVGYLWSNTYLAGDVVYLYVTADMGGTVTEGASFNFELPDTESNFGFDNGGVDVIKVDGGLAVGSSFTMTNSGSELTVEFYEDGTTQINNTIITGFVSDPDATVEISLDYGTTLTAIAVDGGSWSYDLTSDPNYVGDGYYNIDVVATDLSLNEAFYYGNITLATAEVVVEDFETLDATSHSGIVTLPSGDWDFAGAIGSNNHPYSGAVSLGLLHPSAGSATSPLIDAEFPFSFQYYSNGAEFTILQSIDEGPFEPVETLNENTGTYQYYEYNSSYLGSSVRYLIQVDDLNSSDTLFIDDFSFVAYDTSPGITIYSPYGGEEVPLDYEYYIYWDEQNIDATDVVTIELSIDGGSSFPYTLASDLSENLIGQYYWTPTGSEFITESAVIKVSAAGAEAFSDSFFIVDGFGGLESLYESFDFGLLDTEEANVDLSSGTWNTQGVISAASIDPSYALNGTGDAVYMNVAGGNYIETPYVYGATEFVFHHRAVSGGTTGFLFDIYLSTDDGVTFDSLETSGGGTSLSYEEFYHSFSEPYTGPIRIVYNASGDDFGLVDEFSTDGLLGVDFDYTVEDFESISLQSYNGPTTLPSGDWDFTNAYGNDVPSNRGSFSMGVTVGTSEVITPYLIGGTEVYFQYYGTDVDFSVYEQQNEGAFELVTSLSAISGFYEEFYYYTSETDSVRLRIVPENGTSDLLVDDFQFAPVPKFINTQTVVESSVFFDNNKVTITFSDNVYATNAGSGLLDISDFIITSNPSDLNAQITSVTQTAEGDPLVTLLLDQDYFPTGAETIGISFATNSIYDTNDELVADTTVTFTMQDVVGPEVTVNTNGGYVNSTILTGTIETDATLLIELTASRLTGDGVVVGTDWSFDLSTHPDWDVNGGNYPLFKITATDTAGNSTDLSQALVIDTTPPVAPTVNSLFSASTTFTLNGTYDELGTDYLRISLDGVNWDTLVVDGGGWGYTYSGIANGIYDVQLEASDLAGNVTSDETIDELEVAVNYPVITGPSEITIEENSTELFTYESDQVVSWALGGDDVSLFTLVGDSTLTFALAPDFENPGDLNADNIYDVQVIATNLEGNSDTVFVLVSVADANDNAPEILDPGAISIDENSFVGSLVVDCEFTDIDTVTSENTWSIVSGNLDINSNTELPFGINSTGQIVVVDSTDLDFELAPSFTLEVVLNDGLFNDTLLLNINLNQVITDVTAPIITADDLLTNDISPELTGTIDDNDATVSITVDGASYEAVNNADGTWTLAQATIADLAEGVYSFDAVATDSVGNVGSITATLEIDLTAPVVTINTVTTEDDSPELTGTVDDTNAEISVTVNALDYLATNNEDGTWTLASGIIIGLPVNVYDVTVQALDSAGNTGSDATSAELEILPGAPVAFEADEIDFLSFRAYWSNRGGVANYEFDVATDITFVNRATGFNNLSLTDTTVLVTGLDYNTTYYYRARAVYEGGAVSPYSNVITVSTLSDASTTADSLALLDIYEALSGPEWTTNNWTENLPLSDWTGVTMAGTRVTVLNLSANNLKGDFPEITSGLEALTSLDLSDNELTSIGDISHYVALETINISDNRMAFGSIENVFFAGITATVSPQKTLLTRERTLEEIGSTYTVDRTVSGSDNVYSWTKNGVPIAETTGSFDVSIANFSADGTYVAKVKSNVIPLIELTTEPVVLRVSSLERDSTSLMTIYESLDGTNSTLSDWTTMSIRDWPEVVVSDNRVTALTAPGAGLSGAIPEDIIDIRGLITVDLSGNAIDGLPNLEGYLPNLTSFDVSGNKLSFEYLEENTGVTGIDYSDQQAFGTPVSEVLPEGSEYIISVPVGGTANTYEWTLMSPVDTAVVEGEISSELLIPAIDYESMGTYTLQVTNDLVPGLVLKGEPQQLLASANLNFTALDQGGDPFITGEAYALQVGDNPEGYDTIQTVRGAGSGFAFESLILGDYLIAVAPDFTVEFMPTYYANQYDWELADVMKLRADSTEELSMQVNPGSVGNGGSDGGKVSGNVESNFGATTQGRIEARRKVKRAGCSVRRFVPKGRTDQEDGEFVLYAYVESNDEGQFEFTELEDGRYRFNIEYPGIPMDEDSYVEFVIGEGGIEDEELILQATVTEDGIFVEKIERLGFYRKYFKDLNVYPNPADNYLHISYGKLKSSNVTVRLIDLNGNVIKEQQIEKGDDKELDFDVSEITNGIYLINFVDTSLGSERITSFKVFVRH